MSQGARFRYALQPVLLTRQWELEALLLELAEHNTALAQQQGKLAQMDQLLAAADADFKAMAGNGAHLSVQVFSILSRYMADMARQIGVEQQELARLAALRDAAAARVMAGQRGVEAVEQHRDEMQEKFVQQRLSGEFKLADDQWSTLQARLQAQAPGNDN